MTLSKDGRELKGNWWYGDNVKERVPVRYVRISDEMPAWLEEEDFAEFASFLASGTKNELVRHSQQPPPRDK